MRGSVTKEANGTWTAVYDAGQQPRHECDACGWLEWVGPRPPVSSCPKCQQPVEVRLARRQIRKRGFARKTGPGGADAWLAEQTLAVERGVHVDPSKVTVRQFIEEVWQPALTVSPGTRTKYEQVCRCNLLPLIGEVRLQALDAPRIVAMMSTLEKTGGRSGKGLSPKSLKHVYYTLNKAMNDAVMWEYLDRSPLERLKGPVVPEGEMVVWDQSEMQAFLQWLGAQEPVPAETLLDLDVVPYVARGRRLLPMWQLDMTTGMRLEELRGLRWVDVDWDANTIAIEWVLVDPRPDELVYKRPKSNPRAKDNASRRKIVLDDRTMDALRRWRRQQMAERLAAGDRWVEDVEPLIAEFPDGKPNSIDLVFRQVNGEPLEGRRISACFPKLTEYAGLPRLTVHGIRHTYATLMLKSGVHVKVVSQRLGHTNVGITLNLYSWVLPAMDEDAAARGAALLYDAVHKPWVRRCAACDTVGSREYGTKSQAQLDRGWTCESCGAAIAEVIERPDEEPESGVLEPV